MAYFIINHLGEAPKDAQCDTFFGFMRVKWSHWFQINAQLVKQLSL